jgi:transcriptional regulator with XRE-family HTH domain
MKRYPRGTWMQLQSRDTLRALMDQRGLSLDRLARYAGCSKSMISHLTAGRKKTCSTKLGERIAEALDVPLEVLFVPSTDAERSQTVGTTRENVA